MLTSLGRKIKQANVILGWFIFLLSFFCIIWLLFARPESSETIEGLKIENLRASLKEDDQSWKAPFTYDGLVEVSNPNKKFNAIKISYIFEVFDSNEEILGEKRGSTDILAGGTKNLEEEITISSSGKDIKFRLESASWERAKEENN